MWILADLIPDHTPDPDLDPVPGTANAASPDPAAGATAADETVVAGPGAEAMTIVGAAIGVAARVLDEGYPQG